MRHTICFLALLTILACSQTGLTDIVDPFWGSGACDSPASEGISRSWSWEKAQSGNTHPGAVLPYSWTSACGFSGGYSSGYGRIGYSSCEVPPVMLDSLKLWGVTHIHQSGVGLMRKFYNYFLFTPYSDGADLSQPSAVACETAKPGYYAAQLTDYGSAFELTVRPFAALHRYSFPEGKGHLRVDASHAGLGTQCFKPIRPYEKAESIQSCTLDQVADDAWTGTMTAYGVPIHYAICAPSNVYAVTMDDTHLDLTFGGKRALVAAGFSLESREAALKEARLAVCAGFNRTRSQATQTWEKSLGRVKAKFADPQLQKRFYSILYQSMIKPCKCAPGRYTDFTTFWDQYHTALPMALSFAPGVGRGIAEHLMKTTDNLGFSPISQILDTAYVSKDNQATTLPVYTLCDAFWRGLIPRGEYPRLKAVFEKEFVHADLIGTPPSHTLDLSGAAGAAAKVARACSDEPFAASLEKLSCIWEHVYDPSTGLLFEEEQYYEGNHFNYSFRAHPGMAERIALSGGTEGFCAQLDEFFGYNADTSGWTPETDRIRRRNYFEGLNNEPDMDTPYTYLWCGRADRMAEVVDMVRKYRFADGEGGCPGNNDACATSSWYVWNCLGFYPLAGMPYYLLGSPSVESAKIEFANGTLSISVERESPSSIYPVSYEFNGKAFREPWIEVAELESGGKLVFHLSDKPSSEHSPIPDWL